MDATKKLKKSSLKSFIFIRKSRTNITEESLSNQKDVDCYPESNADVALTTRGRAASIFRSLKKKCKGTLIDFKPKPKITTSSEAKAISQLPVVQKFVLNSTQSSSDIVESDYKEINSIPPPVPPRVFEEPFADMDEPLNECGKGVLEELSSLARCGWYWGSIAKGLVEEKLRNEPDGAFLVRDSSSDNHVLTLSFRSGGKTLHTRIEHSCGYYTFCSQQQGVSSIVELIEKSIALSKDSILFYSSQRPDDIYPRYLVRLTKPISRFTEVRSLQYLCRFVIRKYVTADQIPQLLLPQSVVDYLQQNYW